VGESATPSDEPSRLITLSGSFTGMVPHIGGGVHDITRRDEWLPVRRVQLPDNMVGGTVAE